MQNLTKYEPLVLRPHGIFTPLFYVLTGVAIAIGAFAYHEPTSALLGVLPIAVGIVLGVRRIEIRVIDGVVTIAWHNYLTRRLPESCSRSSIIAPVTGTPSFGEGYRDLVIMTKQGQIALTARQRSGDLEGDAFKIGQYLEL
jgi:hypothetical protein